MAYSEVMQSSQWNHFWSVKVLLSVLQVQLFTFYLYVKYNFVEYFYFYLSSFFSNLNYRSLLFKLNYVMIISNGRHSNYIL